MSLASVMPRRSPRNPTTTLREIYTAPRRKSRSRKSPYISASNVEKVVNDPKIPTITIILKFSLTEILSVRRISRNPIRNEPVKLISNVGKGKCSKTLARGEIFTKYRATAPMAPPAAMKAIFVIDSTA